MLKNLCVPWKESCSHCISLLAHRQKVNENPALRVGFTMSTGTSQRWTVLFLDQEQWINLQPHNLFQRTQKFIATVFSLCIMLQVYYAAVSEKITFWYMDPLWFHQFQEDIQHWEGLCLTFGTGVFYWCDLFPKALVSATPSLLWVVGFERTHGNKIFELKVEFVLKLFLSRNSQYTAFL